MLNFKRLSWFSFSLVFFCLTSLHVVAQAGEVKIEPRKILEQALDYIKNAKNLNIEAELMFDRPVDDQLYVQNLGTVNIKIARPNKFFVFYKDQVDEKRFWYDGKHITYLDVQGLSFAKKPGQNNIETTVSNYYQVHGVRLPLTRLFFADPHLELANKNLTLVYLGLDQLEEGSTHHILVHGNGEHIQLWVDAQGPPKLRKVMVMNQEMLFGPRYGVYFRTIDQPSNLDDSVFSPQLPKEATQGDLPPHSPGQLKSSDKE